MRVLLIDAGNARVKWAVRQSGSLGRTNTAEFLRSPEAAISQICASAAQCDVVAVSNVAGYEFAERLEIALKDCFSGRLWFAQSTTECNGIRNGYAVTNQLGIDRWSAIVAACTRTRAIAADVPICVVDAGTALTVDAVDEGGRHLGGFILPGLALQRDSLMKATAGIASRAATATGADATAEFFATDTSSAIERSAVIAAAALIDRCGARLGASGPQPVVLLTGGDAPMLGPWLATAFKICPNLVLEGLAILFEQQSPN